MPVIHFRPRSDVNNRKNRRQKSMLGQKTLSQAASVKTWEGGGFSAANVSFR
jgi:hypothetical protein